MTPTHWKSCLTPSELADYEKKRKRLARTTDPAEQDKLLGAIQTYVWLAQSRQKETDVPKDNAPNTATRPVVARTVSTARTQGAVALRYAPREPQAVESETKGD